MIKSFRYKTPTHTYKLLSYIFWVEYFSKLKNPEEARKITKSTFSKDEGIKYTEGYFQSHFRKIENLHNIKFAHTHSTAVPLILDMTKYIKDNHLSEDKDTFIIQIGSSSGLDLKFFYDQFPKLNYISTDINDEILNYQKEKFNLHNNFKFFKCYAEEIDKCFEKFNLKKKRIILFSRGSLQYVVPYFLEIFFSKIKLHKDSILFLCEPVVLKSIKNTVRLSAEHRSKISFSHNYRQIAQKNGLGIIKEKLMHGQSKDDLVHKHTFAGLNYLCCKID